MYISNKLTISLSLFSLYFVSIANAMDSDLMQAIEASRRQADQEAVEDMLLQMTIQENLNANQQSTHSQQRNDTANDEALAWALYEQENNIAYPTPVQQPNIRQQTYPQTQPQIRQQQPGVPNIQINQNCTICLDQKNIKEFKRLGCNHAFCNACLNAHMNTALQAKNTHGLVCPIPECKRPMTEGDIRVINPAKLTEFADIATKAALQNLQNIKQCPTPNCPMMFEVEQTNAQTITCPACKKSYCSQCSLEHNSRVSCTDARLTTNKTEAEKASEQWKNEHTKPCPGCNRRIEKNDGCLHMTCRECRHQFCWKCLQPWQGHIEGYYQCSRAEINPVAPAQQPQNLPRINNNQHNFNNQPPISYIALQAPFPILRNDGQQLYQYIIRFNRQLSFNNRLQFYNFIGQSVTISPGSSSENVIVLTPLNREQMQNTINQVNDRLALFVTQRH